MSVHTMHQRPILFALIAVLALTLSAGRAPIAAQPVAAHPSSAAPGDTFRSSPVMFIENAGQWDDGARFQVWGGPAGTMWLAEDAIWITIVESAVTDAARSDVDPLARLDPERKNVERENVPRRSANIKLSFVGANPHPRIEPVDRLDTVVSYFIGNELDKWRPDVPVWSGVRYVDLYPGVDLEIYGESGKLVQRLVAEPSMDVSAVRLQVEGADAVTADGNSLRLSTAAGEVALPLLGVDKLQVGGLKTEDPAVENSQLLSVQAFDIAAPFAPANADLQSAIANLQSPTDNPADLLYGTYLGGNADEWEDHGLAIAVNASGAIYVTGRTDTADFPTTPGAFDRSYNGGETDAFVAMLNPSGAALTYITFLGGSSKDWGAGIAAGGTGAAYITGGTASADFPTTSGAFDRSYNGGNYDVFVVKLNASGSALTYATFLGGSSSEWNYDGIAVDGSGAAYVTGWTWSSTFPTTSGAFDRSFNGVSDAFVVKLNASGSTLVYGTFLGGSKDEWGSSIAVGGRGDAYITGGTASADFPTTPGVFDRSHNGWTDAFVVKLNASGSSLLYATFLGGGDNEGGEGIAVDGNGAAYVTGITASTDFPTTPGAFDRSYNGGENYSGDAFAVKVDPEGSTLTYGTFLGGSGGENGNGIAVDGSGAAYLTGETRSVDFPATLSAFDCSLSGAADAFVAKLNPAGSGLAYATFLGGSSFDYGYSVAMDNSGVAHVTGLTHSSDFPTTSGAFDRSKGGYEDAYIVKLAMGVAPTYTISGRVTDTSGHGISGVTVWAGFPRATTTDANGNYTFTGLPVGTYAIRPEKDPYAFSPASLPVTVPPDATGVNFTAVAITKIQVNQALGNTTNYVAGKDTVIQVMLSDYVRYDPANQQVVVKRDGAIVTTLRPLKPAFPTQILNFWGKMEDCQNWQEGSYTFEATINGSQMVEDGLQFHERRTLRILAVPVKTKINGQVKTPSDRWKHAQEFMRQTYPVANGGISYRPAETILDATFWDLTTDSGRIALWLQLSLYQPVLCGKLGQPACYDAIVGVIPEAQLCPAEPCTQGWTAGPPATVVMDTKNLPTSIAHELGHMVGYDWLFVRPGLGDEYGGQCGVFQCGTNPPPQSYLGRTSTYGSCVQHCSDPTVQAWDGWMGSAVRTEDGPFEVGGRLGLGRKLSFMGAAGKDPTEYWVTPRAYDYLFGQLPQQAVVAAALSTERVAEVRGWVGVDDHASLDPVYHLMTATPPAITGPYSVEVLGAEGTTLTSQGFNVSFVALSNPPQDVSEAPFRVAVRFPEGARTVRVKHGAAVLTEMTVSAHAPTLLLSYPTSGESWAADGNYTIRWQGNDIDGGTLHYTVLYRQSTGDWSVLGGDLTTSELVVNARDLPGGTAARVQVLATDGINTTVVESAPFTVGRKPPEAFITYPANGASFMPGVSLFLQGVAYDLEDGTLPDSTYRWSSDKDGDLGTGASNLVTLSSGPHVITLTVMDSDGNTAVKTVRLSAGHRLFLPTVLRGQ